MSGSGGKPAQTGLVDMGNIAFQDGNSPVGGYTPQTVYDPTVSPLSTIPDLTNYKGLFSEVVVNVTWAQLQATPGTSAIASRSMLHIQQ